MRGWGWCIFFGDRGCPSLMITLQTQSLMGINLCTPRLKDRMVVFFLCRFARLRWMNKQEWVVLRIGKVEKGARIRGGVMKEKLSGCVRCLHGIVKCL